MEFDLIARIRARATRRDDVVLGIGDDAAVLSVPPGLQLVVAMDTLNDGVHFPRGTHPSDVGWKALAVNLSDLAAMGAQPAWCTLSLSLPAPDLQWVDDFLDGFLALAALHRVALVGGDTTRGPLSVCVTVHGLIEPGQALRRDGAQVGDDVWVSGTLGDAAAGLALVLDATRVSLQKSDATPAIQSHALDSQGRETLRSRLDRPTPRVALGRALRGLATACIDVSDGLLADIAHVAQASHVGIDITLAALPESDALRAHADGARLHMLQASGGDDYELAFTAASANRNALEVLTQDHGVRLSRIGTVRAGVGVVAFDADARPLDVARRGYEHFDPVG